MNREDLAWAAGIHSGEGSVKALRVRGWLGVMWSVAQTSNSEDCPEMLLRLKKIFGFGRLTKSGRRTAANRAIWTFAVSNHTQVQAAIAMMWNWLTPEKKDQAEKHLLAAKAHRETIPEKFRKRKITQEFAYAKC